jgi:hypothetical protein
MYIDNETCKPGYPGNVHFMIRHDKPGCPGNVHL